MAEKKKEPAKKAPAKKAAAAKKGAPAKKTAAAKKPAQKKTAAPEEITQTPSGVAPLTGAVTPLPKTETSNPGHDHAKVKISTTPATKPAPAKKKSFFARLFRR
jgi:hypothetical protein